MNEPINYASMALGFTGFLCISLSYGLGIVTIPKMLIGELNPQVIQRSQNRVLV